jgi:hypothetical protein
LRCHSDSFFFRSLRFNGRKQPAHIPNIDSCGIRWS